MGSSRTSLKSSKLDSRSAGKSHAEGEKTSSQRLSTRSILSAIGSKLFSGIQGETKKVEEKQEELKPIEEKVEIAEKKSLKDEKKLVIKNKKENVEESWKRNDRDFVKFKSRYNNGIGNIMRSWMSLIYCILILRLNLIKYVQDNLSELHDFDAQLHKQLREEDAMIYKMIRKAQSYSQERSLYLWTHLEKLMYSRMLIKNALDVLRGRDANKDWKGAALRLAQIEAEVENARNVHKRLTTNSFSEEVEKLEEISATKGKALEQLISQISQLKKKEVQMRGRILLNMKNYKDLSNKRKHLLGVQRELNIMKANQNAATKEYALKIEALKSQIDDSEKQIKLEKEEIKKLRAHLDMNGDPSQQSVAVSET